MLVKKLGYTLLFKCKLYILLQKTSHFLMILSFLLILIIPNFKEKYEAQQPSLKTKIYEVQSAKANFVIPYDHVYPGINIAISHGFLSYQSILLTYPCQSQQTGDQESVMRDVFYTLSVDRNLAKNVAFLCYEEEKKFDEFLQVFHTKPINNKNNIGEFLGIIRGGLHVDLADKSSKVFFKIYGKTGLYPDLDYYFAIKELLSTLNIDWLPCEVIYKNEIYNWIRKATKNSELLFKELLCQFHELLTSSQHQSNIHGSLMSHGIQSATIKTYPSSSQTPIDKSQFSKFVLSFVKEFSVFEDHLHSASTLYYPYNEYDWIDLKGFILPGLIFLVFTVIYLINLFYNSDFTSVKLTINSIAILICLFVSSWQYQLFSSIKYSFWIGILVRLILNQFIRKLQEKERKLLRILLTGFNAVMAYHTAFFITPLSFLCMICVCFIAFVHPRLLFLMIFVSGLLVTRGQVMEVWKLSQLMMVVLYPMSIWITLI